MGLKMAYAELSYLELGVIQLAIESLHNLIETLKSDRPE